jgi:transcription initiation factor TFIID subunit 7
MESQAMDMGEEVDLDLEAALDEAKAEELEAATPMSTLGATPSLANGAGSTPMEDFDSGDESIEDGDDEDEAEEEDEIDEDEKARLAQVQGTREVIAELESKISNSQAQLAVQGNLLLRRRLEDGIRKLKQELQLKKSSVGEIEENE